MLSEEEQQVVVSLIWMNIGWGVVTKTSEVPLA